MELRKIDSIIVEILLLLEPVKFEDQISDEELKRRQRSESAPPAGRQQYHSLTMTREMAK